MSEPAVLDSPLTIEGVVLGEGGWRAIVGGELPVGTGTFAEACGHAAAVVAILNDTVADPSDVTAGEPEDRGDSCPHGSAFRAVVTVTEIADSSGLAQIDRGLFWDPNTGLWVHLHTFRESESRDSAAVIEAAATAGFRLVHDCDTGRERRPGHYYKALVFDGTDGRRLRDALRSAGGEGESVDRPLSVDELMRLTGCTEYRVRATIESAFPDCPRVGRSIAFPSSRLRELKGYLAAYARGGDAVTAAADEPEAPPVSDVALAQ